MWNLPEAGTELCGKYRIVRLVGQGGMGAVYEAEHMLTLRRVAVKWLRPDVAQEEGSAARLVREALASARVRHPNVVEIYDVVEHRGATFLVMEYLEGESLTDALARGDLELHTLFVLLIGAIRGAAAAHKCGVIHRDIKPDNIFLSRLPDSDELVPKVLDFGIAKVNGEGKHLTATRPVTLSGRTMGTPMYMSHEQLTRGQDVDGRADVYAFGVILYQALTGHVPYEATTLPELIVQIATIEPVPAEVHRPGIPPALAKIVADAMAKDREQRTPSLTALANALEPFATEDALRAQFAHDSPSHSPPWPVGPVGTTEESEGGDAPTRPILRLAEASPAGLPSGVSAGAVRAPPTIPTPFVQAGTPREREPEVTDAAPEKAATGTRLRPLLTVVVGIAATLGIAAGSFLRTTLHGDARARESGTASSSEVAIERAQERAGQARRAPAQSVAISTSAPAPAPPSPVPEPSPTVSRQPQTRHKRRARGEAPAARRSQRTASERAQPRREAPGGASGASEASGASGARAATDSVPAPEALGAEEAGLPRSPAPLPSEPAEATRRFRVALPTVDQFF